MIQAHLDEIVNVAAHRAAAAIAQANLPVRTAPDHRARESVVRITEHEVEDYGWARHHKGQDARRAAMRHPIEERIASAVDALVQDLRTNGRPQHFVDLQPQVCAGSSLTVRHVEHGISVRAWIGRDRDGSPRLTIDWAGGDAAAVSPRPHPNQS
ncbi:MAG: hypothetical protein WAT39_01890 [Planctomycetota bacterium]